MVTATVAQRQGEGMRQLLFKFAWIVLLGFCLPFCSQGATAFASPGSGITYHGRILKPDGAPLDNPSVQFKIQLLTGGAEACLMYEEMQTLNLQNTKGVFSLTINDGTGTRTDSTGLTIDQVFQNRGSFTFSSSTCMTGGSGTTAWAPNASDGRKIQVLFKSDTMAQWEQLPVSNVNFSPMTIEAKQVGGFRPDNLLRVDDAAATSNTTPFTTTQLNNLVSLINGTSAQYVRSSGTAGAAMPSFNGTPSTLAAGSMWFDSSTSELKYYNGTTVMSVGAGGGGTGTVTGITVGTGLVDGTGVMGTVISSTGTIALPNIGTAGAYYKVTTDAQGRVSSGVASLLEADIPTLTTAGKVSGGAINSGTIGGTTAISTSGNLQTSGDITAKRIFVQDSGTNYAGIKAPAAVTSTYSLTLPAALPASAGQVLSSDTSGNLSWVSPGTGSVASVGVTAPIQNTGSASAPVIAISQANGTTDGYLSSADWNTFNGKLGSTLASGKIWVGNGSNVATAVTPSGDVTITTAGGFTVTQIQGVAVSATAPTTAGQVLRYDGTGSYVPAQLSTSDISGLSTALSNKIDATQMPSNCGANQTLTFSSPTGAWTCSNIAITGSAFGSQAANTVLAAPNGSAGNPTFRTLVATDVPVLDASKITSGVLAVAQGGTGTSDGSITGTGALTFAAGGTNQDVTLTPSGTGHTILGGNVGVGTTSPSTRLEIDSGIANTSGVKLSRLTSSSPTTAGQPVGVDASGNLITVAVSGSGTVNSGTQNQLAWYGANGSAVSGLATANNGVLVTDGSGVPSISSTLPLSAQSNITQTGTITSGTWNGSVIGAQYGGTGLNASSATNGQLLIGNGAGFTLAGITGTANRVTVTAGAGSITLSAPQDIHSGASPTFAGLTLSGMSTAGIVKNSAAGVLSGGNTVNLASDIAGTLGVANGGTGLTTLATNSLLYGNGTGNMNALASVNSAVLTTSAGGVPQWSTVASDTFTQYALLAGRSGGQTLNGGAAANNNLTLDSTANATKGNIILAPSGGNVGIGTTSPAAKLDVAGEIKFGNTSSTCNAGNEGQQRYHATNKTMEYCNGASWISLNQQKRMQVYTTTGANTFTTPVGTNSATQYKFTIIGGGGGGSGSSGSYAGTGGNAGATAIYVGSGVAAGTNISITVGTAGSGGGSSSNGNAGGNSSVVFNGTTITANGGAGGNAGTGEAAASTASNGTINISGGRGSYVWGWGGSSTLGQGGNQPVSGTGQAGNGYGAGGAGPPKTNQTGGAGSQGVVIVEWVQ